MPGGHRAGGAVTAPFAVMGVDPGVRGGVAVLDSVGTVLFVQGFNPKMLRDDLRDLMREAGRWLKSYNGGVAYLEKVGYMPGDGGMGAFTFGRAYGSLEQSLLAQDIKVYDVLPILWQASMECLTGGNKNVSKRRALELFPAVPVTHNIADALLIAEFGRRRLASGRI